MSEDVNELQKEWRAIVLGQLNGIATSIVSLNKEISEMKQNFAQNAEVQSLRIEVDKLKEFKSRAIGVLVAVNAIVAVIGWGISLYFSAGHTIH